MYIREGRRWAGRFHVTAARREEVTGSIFEYIYAPPRKYSAYVTKLITSYDVITEVFAFVTVTVMFLNWHWKDNFYLS